MLQNVIAPSLKALDQKVDAHHRENQLYFEGINRRFDELIERLELAKRIESLERDRDERQAN